MQDRMSAPTAPCASCGVECPVSLDTELEVAKGIAEIRCPDCWIGTRQPTAQQVTTMQVEIPRGLAERLNWFRQLAHVVHLGRCTRFPFGDCTRHEDAEYFTPKDNDIASLVIRWLECGLS